MSMSVQNNLMALHAGNILSSNIKKKDRAGAHLALGEKIASAGEGGSCGQHQTTSGWCCCIQSATKRALADCGEERKPCR